MPETDQSRVQSSQVTMAVYGLLRYFWRLSSADLGIECFCVFLGHTETEKFKIFWRVPRP